jgi:putative transposase
VNEHDSKKGRRSIRLRGYDYTRPGDRSFGQVLHGEMRLNVYGQIVRDCWKEIPAHFPHATLDTFVVMPNHLHGIILVGARHAVPLRNNSANPSLDRCPRWSDPSNRL